MREISYEVPPSGWACGVVADEGIVPARQFAVSVSHPRSPQPWLEGAEERVLLNRLHDLAGIRNLETV